MFNPDPGVRVRVHDPIVRLFRLTDSLEVATGVGGPRRVCDPCVLDSRQSQVRSYLRVVQIWGKSNTYVIEGGRYHIHSHRLL